ncbi:MAG: DUF975 family protein [Oscillospiraceae bacterium]|nr:DUF975 family protein [Oscillospiraceae bacterium]
MNENRIDLRKSWKKRAKQVVKTHYVMAVILCLIAVFFGTEFVFIRTQAENLYAAATGQEIRLGGSMLKLDSVSARDKVISDLIEDNINAGRQDAAEQLTLYKNAKLTNSVLGRQKGIFASVANTVASGHLYMILFGGLHSLLHSTRVASALVVLGSLLLTVLAWIFLQNMYRAILRRVFLEARVYGSVPMSHLLHFRLMGRWVRAAMTLLLQSVLEFLWALTVVGVFIKHFSYILVPYIVAENPDIKPREAIRLSRRMMNGHKWECFRLHLTFIGWYLLGLVTFGVTDVFWTLPYEMAVFSEFYAAIRSEAREKGVEGAERLNDTYLYEKAEEALLRSTYQDIEEQKHFIDEHRVTLPPVRRFFARNFGLWIGSTKEKAMYDEVDTRRQQIVEDRAVIKGRIYPQRLAPLWNDRNNSVVRKIRYIRTYTVWSVILAFFTFAFVGWAWEVSLHLVGDGVFINRGVMHGPWLPIYGSGVVMIMLVLARWRRRPIAEAAAIVLLCGAVEYGTSYVLEAISGMRWWDYTGYFLNLNGRICGEGLTVFALGGMAAVYLLLPILDTLWSRIRPKVTVAICTVLVLAFCADLVYTHKVPNVGEGITDYTAYEEVQDR